MNLRLGVRIPIRIGLLGMAIWACAASVASAQTFLGVLTTPPNSGQGNSCCSRVAKLDASNAAVPNDGSCPGCTVITPQQYAAYQAAWAAVNAPQQCTPGSVYSDGANLNVCDGTGQSVTQFPLTVLGNGVVNNKPPSPKHGPGP